MSTREEDFLLFGEEKAFHLSGAAQRRLIMFTFLLSERCSRFIREPNKKMRQQNIYAAQSDRGKKKKRSC